MKKSRHLGGMLVCLFVLLGLNTAVHAATASYYLDQSNIDSLMPDGSNYLRVTISDDIAGQVDFTVETIPGAFVEGTNFGIQAFSFNIAPSTTGLAIDNFLLPQSWTANIAPPPNTQDGFGGFDILVSDGGSNRQDPLHFVVLDLALSDLVPVELSSGNAGQGNVAFAAHVADFITSDSNVTSGFFGGSTVVPVPAAVWLFGSGLMGLVGIATRKKSC